MSESLLYTLKSLDTPLDLNDQELQELRENIRYERSLLERDEKGNQRVEGKEKEKIYKFLRDSNIIMLTIGMSSLTYS